MVPFPIRVTAPLWGGLLVLVAFAASRDLRTPERRAREWLADLRAADRLPVPDTHVTDEVRDFFEQLDGIRVANSPAAEAAAGFRFPKRLGFSETALPLDALGAPWSWKPEESSILDAHLNAARPTLEALDELLASPCAREALAANGPVAPFCGSESSSTCPTILSLSDFRHWGNLLGASAVRAARSEEPELAVARIAQAFDLAFLTDGGSTYGTILACMQESQAAHALQYLVEEHLVAPDLLREAIDPRLARAVRKGRMTQVAAAALLETEMIFASALEGGHGPWTTFDLDPPSSSAAAASMIEQLHAFERVTAGEEPCGLVQEPESELLNPQLRWNVSWLHGHQERMALSRVALAARVHHEETGAWPGEVEELEPWFPNGVPENPCDHHRFQLLPRGGVLLVTLSSGLRGFWTLTVGPMCP